MMALFFVFIKFFPGIYILFNDKNTLPYLMNKIGNVFFFIVDRKKYLSFYRFVKLFPDT